MSTAVRRNLAFLAICFLTQMVFAGPSSGEEFPNLKGPWLGQVPPGLTPVKFAPGIISTEGNYEGGATFSPDGIFFVYKRFHPEQEDPEEIWMSDLRDGRWAEPYRAPFDGEHSDWDFGFARAGSAFYFTSKRPATVDGKKIHYSGIWVTERSGGSWTEPRRLGPPVNVLDTYSGYPSVTLDGTVYFHSEREDTRGDVDIYRARLRDGEYREVENVGVPVNSKDREFDPCIAPDESYLLFISNRPGEYEEPYDTYISFRNADDTWTEPRGLGPILGMAALPQVSADGRYFFFVGGDPERTETKDIYWVDTKIFDKLRPKGPR